MSNSSKKSANATKVEAAPASITKPLKKGKRDAEDDLDIQVNPKKHKTELKKAQPKKVETSSSDSSDSSDSEEEQKTKKVVAKKPLSKTKNDSSSDDSSSSDEEPAPPKKQPPVLKKAEAESSSSEEESSSDEDEEPTPPKQPAVVKEAEAESSDDESSSDEESAPAKKQPTTLKDAKAESSSSEEESSSDEEPAPPKKQPEVVKDVKIAEPAVKDSSSSEEESEDEKEPATKELQPSAMSKSDSSEEDSDDEESADEKPPKKKAKVSSTKTSKQESTSDESSEEESEDEKVTPKKKDSDIDMVEADQKSSAKQPKTPATQTQGGSKTLFVGNLYFQIERSDVEEFFKECGEVVDVRFASHEDGSFKGFGHVEFASAEAAQKALNLNGKKLLGREVRLDPANERGAFNTPRSSNNRVNYQKSGRGEGSQSKTVFVKGIDSSVAEHEMKSALRDHFSACGEITRIAIPTDRETGASKGIAFIDLKDGVNKALELSGSEIGGRNIVVNEARPREESGDVNSGRFSSTGRDNRGRHGPRRRDNRGRRGRDNRGRGRDSGRLSKPSVLASAQGKKIVFDE